MCTNRLKTFITGLAVALALVVTPAAAQTGQPDGRIDQPSTPQPAGPMPWLVTIVYELSIKDLVDDWRAQGLSVSPLKGIPESETITNIVPGLVLKPSGQIVGRLTNFRVTPKPDRLTVITADGRRLNPTSVKYDPVSGYSVLEVSNLDISPPPFASPASLAQQPDIDLRLLFQVPEWSKTTSRDSDAPEPSASVMMTEKKRTKAGSQARRIDQLRPSVVDARVIQQHVRVEAARTASEASVDSGVKRQRLEMKAAGAPDGSIVLNQRGEVMGLMESVESATATLKSIEDLRQMADRMVASPLPRRGWVGLRLVEELRETAEGKTDPQTVSRQAIVVKEVLPDGPASRAELRPGDVILRLNESAVESLKDLSQHIAETPVGDEISLDVLRGRDVNQMKVKVEPRPRNVLFVPKPAPTDRARHTVGRGDTAGRSKSPPRPDAERLARLGIRVEPMTPEVRNALGVKTTSGVLVTEIATNGAAGKAGLRAGDVIWTVNGKDVMSEGSLLTLLSRASRTGRVNLVVIRHREPARISIEIRQPF